MFIRVLDVCYTIACLMENYPFVSFLQIWTEPGVVPTLSQGPISEGTFKIVSLRHARVLLGVSLSLGFTNQWDIRPSETTYKPLTDTYAPKAYHRRHTLLMYDPPFN